jgi:hypothetical protein
MKEVLSKMVEQLSGEDKLIFSRLAKKLNDVKGDISKLEPSELKIITQMESKYSDKLSQFNEPALSNLNETEAVSNSKTFNDSNVDLLETGFAAHVRQVLARDLKSQFPNEEDAVKFAFQNKWIPQDFKETDKALQIFEDYKQDICDANLWREEVVGVESDKSLAIGMTWFMVIFQLNQKLN